MKTNQLKAIIIGISLSTVLTAGLTGCSGTATAKAASTTSSAISAQTVDSFGVIKSNSIKSITLEVPALVDEVIAQNGQKVKKGDPLIKLNLSEYKQQIAEKESELKSAKLDLAKQQKNVQVLNGEISKKSSSLKSSADPQFAKLSNDLAAARDLYNKEKADYLVKEELFKANAISKTEIDESKKQLDERAKAVKDIEYQISSLKYSKQTEIEDLKTDYTQQNAVSSDKLSSSDILADKITLLEQQINLMKDKLNRGFINNDTIISEFDNAVVYDISCTSGDVLNPSTKLLTILDLDDLVVEADITEDFIKDVKVGADVKIVPQADKTKSFKGKVLRIADKAVVKNSETIVPVQISILDKDALLMPDFNVDVNINIK
jgi:multidrug resistance efflux pump